MLENQQWLQAAASLKAYVTVGTDHATAYQNLPATTVVLDLTHSNLIQRHIEIRFDKHQTLDDLRHKIYQTTGTPHDAQQLQIYAGSDLLVEIPPIDDPSTKLGFYSLQHGMRVHCVDLNPNSISARGQLEDTRLVQKYQMSEEEYNKRKNTLREWSNQQKAQDPSFSLAKHGQEHNALVEAKRLHKLGQPLPTGFEINDKGAVIKSQTLEEDEDVGPDSVLHLKLQERCEVQPGGRRGRVMYVGEVPELKQDGHWVGILFDEPVGKSNGSVNSKIYFEAPDKFGGFCRGKNVTTGDFPERDIFDELDDSSEDEL